MVHIHRPILRRMVSMEQTTLQVSSPRTNRDIPIYARVPLVGYSLPHRNERSDWRAAQTDLHVVWVPRRVNIWPLARHTGVVATLCARQWQSSRDEREKNHPHSVDVHLLRQRLISPRPCAAKEAKVFIVRGRKSQAVKMCCASRSGTDATLG